MKKKLRLMMTMLLLAVMGSVWAETSTLTFTKACGGSGTADDGVLWTVTSDADESNFDNTKGIHYGTSSKAVSYLQLNTSGVNGTITNIVVNASGASNTSAKLNVTVGGNAFGSEQSLTPTAADYTFTGNASGAIVVRLSQESSKKALYVKSIEVTYSTSSAPTVASPTFSPDGGTFSEALSVEISTETQNATIYYTLDGSNPSTSSYEYTNPITIEETTTIKAFAVKEGMNNSAIASAFFTYIDPNWIDFTIQGFDNAQDVTTVSGTGGSVTFGQGTNNQYSPKWYDSGSAIRIYTNNTITITAEDGKKIESVQFSITSGSMIADGFNVEGNYENKVFTLATPANSIVYTTQSNFRLDKIKINLSTDTRVEAGLSYSSESYTATLNGENVFPTLSNPNSLDVTYESTVPSVATVDANGAITIHTAGTTIISASSEGTTQFLPGSASYTLTVIDPNAPGTANNPYTVAQARAAIDAGTGMEGVYARGIVSQTDGLSNGTITYYISDEGTTTNQLEIYKGKSYDGENFTSADEIQVGDIVVVYGNLQKYNSIYEFNATNRLVSLVRPVIPSHDVTFSANGTTFSTITAKEGANIEFPTENPADEGDYKFIGWSTEDWIGEKENSPTTLVTSATMGTEDMTIYAVYAITTEGTSVRWKKMAASEVTEEGTYAIITSTEGSNAYYAFNGTITSGHGQTTPNYFTFDTDGYADSAPAGTCELIFEASGEGFKMRTEDLTANGNKPYLCASKAASGGLTWLNSSDYWSYTSDNWTYSKYFDGTNHYAYLRQYDNTVRTYGTNIGRKIEFAQKVGSITYSNYCTIISGFEKVTLSTDGYITYVTKNAIDWVQTLARNSQEGVDVHGYKVVDFSLDNGVSMVEYGVENLSTVASTDKMYQEPIIPARTPIIIQGKQGDNYMVVADEENVTAPAGNLLRASDGTATTTDEVKLFVLQKIDQSGSGINNYTFYRLTKGRQIPVGKAYLSSEDMTLPNPGTPGVDPNNMPAANFIRILVQTDNDSLVSDDAGIIDGIGTVAQDSEDGQVIYNLNGVKVNNPSKGIYVKNGKKVIIK